MVDYKIGDRVPGCPVCQDADGGCGVCTIGSGWGAGEAELERDAKGADLATRLRAAADALDRAGYVHSEESDCLHRYCGEIPCDGGEECRAEDELDAPPGTRCECWDREEALIKVAREAADALMPRP